MQNTPAKSNSDMISSDVLMRIGDKIEFSDYDDFLKKCSLINWDVPERGKGRKSVHEERYCMKFYLDVLATTHNILFPITVRKTETPDFIILRSSNRSFGLEHTNAGPQEWHRQMSRLSNAPKGSLLECLPEENLEQALREPGENLTGDGWTERGATIEWGKSMVWSIIKKTIDLNEKNYEDAEKYELLIYDSSQVSEFVRDGIDAKNISYMIGLALSLDGKLKLTKRTFDCISIICGKTLYYDITGATAALTRDKVF